MSILTFKMGKYLLYSIGNLYELVFVKIIKTLKIVSMQGYDLI